MTSHLHLIARAKDGYKLSDIYRDYKKFTSKKIVDAIKTTSESRKVWLMDMIVNAGRIDSRRLENKFWKENNHNIILYPASTKIFERKIKYIHDNPVVAGFVEEPEFWKYSSACDYSGKRGMVQIIQG